MQHVTVRRSAAKVLALAALLVAGTVVADGAPVGAQSTSTVVAESVALSSSASCRYGDVEITYRATGAERQSVAFTSVEGAVLHDFETKAYASDYSGLEYILTEADEPPPAGTVVAVYASVGTTPADAATTAEFFVLYSCDPTKNSAGGANRVLWTCVGPYGTCPRTAEEAVATEDGPTGPSGPSVAPAFTG